MSGEQRRNPYTVRDALVVEVSDIAVDTHTTSTQHFSAAQSFRVLHFALEWGSLAAFAAGMSGTIAAQYAHRPRSAGYAMLGCIGSSGLSTTCACGIGTLVARLQS
jgi:hypothetical protein